MPFVGGFRQLRAIVAYSPRSPLVEADGQPDIQVGIIGGIQPGYIIVCYGIGNLTLRDLHDQVFYCDAVIAHLMNVDASSQFLVQIDKPFIILSGFYVHIFANEFRYVFQWFDAPAGALYDDLMRNHFLAAINQAVFPLFRYG